MKNIKQQKENNKGTNGNKCRSNERNNEREKGRKKGKERMKDRGMNERKQQGQKDKHN